MTAIYIAAALVLIVVIAVAFAASKPDDFAVSRQIKIAAPPEEIFPHVNTLKNWEPWNPWGAMDPNCKMVYSGPASGVGASYAWAGNCKVGEGRNTITESKPNELIVLKLEFLKPMVATNRAEFKFQSTGSQTTVTWSMTGKHNLVGKIFGLLMNCDKMIGGQFDKGLATMKSLCESGAAKQTAQV